MSDREKEALYIVRRLVDSGFRAVFAGGCVRDRILGGLEAYGPLGLFLGPAIMSVFAALLRVYRKEYSGSRKEAA